MKCSARAGRPPHSNSPTNLLLNLLLLPRPSFPHLKSISATMTSYLPHDIQSLLPRSSPQTASLPSVGEAAPAFPSSSDIKVVQGGSGGQDINFATPSKGTLVAFVRHCGCPFAEKEIKLLSQVDKQYGGQGEVQIVVVQHSDEEETKKWWERIG